MTMDHILYFCWEIKNMCIINKPLVHLVCLLIYRPWCDSLALTLGLDRRLAAWAFWPTVSQATTRHRTCTILADRWQHNNDGCLLDRILESSTSLHQLLSASAKVKVQRAMILNYYCYMILSTFCINWTIIQAVCQLHRIGGSPSDGMLVSWVYFLSLPLQKSKFKGQRYNCWVYFSSLFLTQIWI